MKEKREDCVVLREEGGATENCLRNLPPNNENKITKIK
jgi:hypothetical protein